MKEIFFLGDESSTLRSLITNVHQIVFLTFVITKGITKGILCKGFFVYLFYTSNNIMGDIVLQTD